MPQQHRKDRARIGSTNVWRNLALTFIVLFVLMLIIFAGLYSSAQNSYQYLLYQYNQLRFKYYSLQDKYNQLLNSLGSASWSGTLGSLGGFLVLHVFIPNGYTGTLSINVSSSAPVDVYVLGPLVLACVFPNSLSNITCNMVSDHYYKYIAFGTNINGEVTLGKGEYMVVIVNNNDYPVQISATISTTYVSPG